jgi:hypothetical protein
LELELEEEDADVFDCADLAAETFEAEPDFEESGFADFAVGDDLRFEVLWSLDGVWERPSLGAAAGWLFL